MKRCRFSRLRSLLYPLMLGLLTVSGSVQAVNSSHVQITVQGTIAGSTCNVVGGPAQTVNLGEVGVAILGSANDAWQWVNFPITLEHCPIGMARATITFTGEPDPDNALFFINTAVSTGESPAADNVAIELAPRTGYEFLSNGSKMVTGVNSTTHKAFFELRARMITPTGRATPGRVSGHVDFTVEYQ